jgi:hypothetical protein
MFANLAQAAALLSQLHSPGIRSTQNASNETSTLNKDQQTGNRTIGED